MKFVAVIFDMDGTLLDTERVCLQTFNDTASEFGLPDLTDTFMKIVGKSGETEVDVITQALLDRVTYDTFMGEWEQRITRALSQSVPVKEEVIELLDHLALHRIPMAVATSTRVARARDHLSKAGLLGYFDHIVGGDQVEKRKPDPEPYLKAAALLGQHIRHCAIFEDSDPGTFAAVRSGGCVVQVPDLTRPSAETIALGHVIAPSLLEGAREIGLI